MGKPILILNGPNLNRLGLREPQIYGSTSLAEVEEMCRKRAEARGHAIAFHQSNREQQTPQPNHQLSLAFAAVPSEGSRRSKFTQFVTNHIFRDKHFHMVFTVMNHECMADKLRNNRASPRPSLNRLFLATLIQPLHLPIELEVDKRALLL